MITNQNKIADVRTRMQPMWLRSEDDPMLMAFLSTVETLLESLEKMPAVAAVMAPVIPDPPFIQANKNNFTSGLRGVTFTQGKYEARVRHKGKAHYLGRFRDPQLAAKAAAEKRRELGMKN